MGSIHPSTLLVPSGEEGRVFSGGGARWSWCTRREGLACTHHAPSAKLLAAEQVVPEGTNQGWWDCAVMAVATKVSPSGVWPQVRPCLTWCSRNSRKEMPASPPRPKLKLFHGTLPYRLHFAWFTRPRHGNKNFSYVGKSSKPIGKKSKTWETTLYLWLRCTAARSIFKEKKIDSSSFLITFCHPKPTYKQEICHNE